MSVWSHRDRVVAELVPPREIRSSLLVDAVLAEAVRKGWLTPPVSSTQGPPPRLPDGSMHELMGELEADRGEH